MLTQAELKSILTYDPETGVFKWKETGKGRRPNLVAGTVNKHGYLVIGIDWHRYMAHVLAWLYVYGVFPEKELDHWDQDTGNNRIANLREVTHSQNLVNSKTRSDNTAGCRGVCWDKQKSRWKVQIRVIGQPKIQKHFVSQAEAIDFVKSRITA